MPRITWQQQMAIRELYPRGPKRTSWNAPAIDTRPDGDYDADEREVVADGEGNVIASICDDATTHLPVLDIDVKHSYVPSSTEGHGHLYLDVPLEWDAYLKLLEALRDAGIIEYGYVEAAKRRGATFVRRPGVLKPRVTLEPF